MVAVKKLTLRYEGLFDFDGLYATITDWAKNYNYKWHESDYKHKVAGKGAEQEFKWVLTIQVTEYVDYKIVIETHTWDMLEVEVEENGKKKSLTNARISIVLSGDVNFDSKKIFGKGRFAETFTNWYNKLFSREMDEYWDQLYFRMQNLHAIIKKYFDMQGKKHYFKGYLGEN